MEGAYEVDSHPFFFNRATCVRLYHGFSLQRNRLPVVIKRHDIYLVEKAQFLEDFNLIVNAGLAQARADHPNACRILEMRLDFDLSTNCYSVFHILEAMDRDVGRELTERQTANQPFTESDLTAFMKQTTEALAHAHSKGIAHRDIKPGNIFMDARGNYKVGDFGSSFEKKATLHAESTAGTLAYMSPQQRQIIAGQEVKYNPFKSDVFGLGLTTLSLASLTPIDQPWPLDVLEDRVTAVLRELQCSGGMKDLMQAMVSIREENRPDMRTVLEVIAPNMKQKGPLHCPFEPEVVKPAIPSYFPSVFNNTLTIYDLKAQRYTRQPLSMDFSNGGSYIPLDEHTLLCLGNSPASAAVLALDLVFLQLTPLPVLSLAREAPGLAKHENCVYVFGGLDSGRKELTNTEKLNLADRRTSELGNMRYPRACFTPCLYRGLFYLVSTRSKAHRVIETFSPSTEVFGEVPIPLPSGLDLGCASAAFIAAGELCLLTANRQMACWKVSSEPQFRLSAIGKKCCSNQPPLVVGTQVLIAYRRKVLRFGLETYSFS